MSAETRFYSALSPVIESLFPLSPELAARVDAMLREAPSPTLLDLGAGGGLLASHASARACRVVAVDNHPEMLAAGARITGGRGRAVDWRLGDLVNVTRRLGERFGVVTCVGNTLLHLGDRARVAAGLRSIAAGLLPGGWLLVQTVNVDRCLMTGVLDLPRKHVAGPHGELALERRYECGGRDRLRFHTSVAVAGERQSFDMEMAAVRAAELRELARRAGLRDVRIHGGYAEEPWSLHSPATILIARGTPL